jgi:hypothetical protein
MPISLTTIRLLMLGFGLLAAVEALAQRTMYRCSSEGRNLSRQQCDEMYRIVHGRRQKVAAMAPGERSDFERFEANWQARCQPG